jgi:hypothetical protein
MYTHFAVTRQNISPENLLLMLNNFSISSWNVQGLGSKYRDEDFLSNLKYDINILLETWKGADPDFCIPNFSIFQKSRKKKKCSKRYSGGIIVLYKSEHKSGISEITNITTSENTLWFKLDARYFGFKNDLYVCACYTPPTNSLYNNDDFTYLENEISSLNGKGNILIIGDLNARVGDKSDFIENESGPADSLLNLLPDNYNEDKYLHRNCIDKVCNTQGQGLLNICVASQLHILNGHFMGDFLGNFTCHKSYGASTVDYALADLDLIKSINYFEVNNATYLSDHSQISVHLYCNIDDESIHKSKHFKEIQYTYKWTTTSQDKLFNVLSERETIYEIVPFENFKFENTSDDVDSADEKVSNIFEKMAKRSCKIVKTSRNKNIKRKNPWSDGEIKDLKKTVIDLGKRMKQQPYNLQIKIIFYKHCKNLKKMIKRKKIFI